MADSTSDTLGTPDWVSKNEPPDQTTRVGDKELTWEQIVSQYGVDQARQIAPQLDPAYIMLVNEKGQAAGSAAYAAQYMDPNTVTAKGWAGLGSPQQIYQGIQEEEESSNPALKALAALGNLATLGQGGPAAPPKGGGASGPSGATDAPTQAQLEAQIAANPFNKLGEGLVKQLQEEQAPIEKAVSGEDTEAAERQAVQGAQSLAGVTPNSSAGQWFNQQIAQANQTDQPMQAAMADYGKAYDAGQKGVDTALGGMGQANALANITAPQQAYLNMIAQHLGSGQYYSLNQAQTSQLPPALLYYLQQAGTQGVTEPKGGWGPNAPGASGATAATGTMPSFGAQVTGAANQPVTSVTPDYGGAPS